MIKVQCSQFIGQSMELSPTFEDKFIPKIDQGLKNVLTIVDTMRCSILEGGKEDRCHFDIQNSQ